MRKRTASGVFGLCLGALLGCDDGSPSGEGDLRVQVNAEESISEGLDPGPDPENTEDYAVRFDKYLAVVGDVEIARSKGGERKQLASTYVVDMLGTGAAGFALGEIAGVASGVWDKFSFRTAAADEDTQRGPGVSQADYDEMVEGGLTYSIVGRVLRDASEGGEVEFRLKLSVPTQYSECSFEGEGGVSITADRTTTATLTLHGDHLFFNAFPAAAEGNIRRMAAWITECDLNGDGLVDNDELAQLDATDVFTQAKGYSLSGAPIPIETALDFARAQLASQGHFRGEGECVWDLED